MGSDDSLLPVLRELAAPVSPALAPGSLLGRYEILAPLAAGGMGEVYRARDTRLGREVAIKILPAAVRGDPEPRAQVGQDLGPVAAQGDGAGRGRVTGVDAPAMRVSRSAPGAITSTARRRRCGPRSRAAAGCRSRRGTAPRAPW